MECLQRACPCLRRFHYSSVQQQDGSSSPSAAYFYPSAHYQSAGGGAALSSSSLTAATSESILPGKIALPRWVMDEEAERCYGCAVPFDVLTRRHHCRRCRNIFCAACTAMERPVRLYRLPEPVRVCMRCAADVVKENAFLDLYLEPLIKGGDMIMSRGILGKKVPVILALSASLDALEVYESNSNNSNNSSAYISKRSPLVKIPLQDIGGVSEEGKCSIMIITSSGHRHKFDISSSSSSSSSGSGQLQQRSLWVSAVREASKVLPLLSSFKTRVESERHQVCGLALSALVF